MPTAAAKADSTLLACMINLPESVRRLNIAARQPSQEAEISQAHDVQMTEPEAVVTLTLCGALAWLTSPVARMAR